MAWTQEQIDTLKAAINSGTRSVQYRDRRVEYHSLKDMIALLQLMEASVAVDAGTPPRTRTFRVFQSGNGQ